MADLSQVSDQDLMAYKQGRMSDVSNEGLLAMRGMDQPANLSQPQEAAQDPGILSRIGSDVQQRLNSSANAPDFANYMISSARIGSGVPTDIIGEVLKSGFNALPSQISQPIKDAMSSVKRGISSLPTTGKSTFGDVGSAAMNLADTAAKAYPTAANALGYASELPVGAAGLKTAIEGGDIALKGLRPEPRLPVTGLKASKALPSDAIKSIGQDIYRGAAQYGGEFNPQFTSKLADSLSEHRITSKFSGIGRGGDNPINKYIEDFQTRLKNEPMSLDDFETMDSELGDLAHATRDIHGAMTNEGTKYMDIQRKLREKVLNPDPGDIIDPTAFEATRKATSIYADYFKQRDIEKVIARSELTDNPTQAMRTGFKNLYLNAKKTVGYSDKEMALLKKASETGVATGLLRLGASRLNAIAAFYAGGPVASGVTYGVGRLAEKAANRLQKGPINKLSGEIGKRVSKNALEGQNLLKGKK